ncbi:MAG: NAD(+) synthase [Lachnospiraceae bacterium]|nr:NAD(+) synthase [Lachnospiraceae bacterium]
MTTLEYRELVHEVVKGFDAKNAIECIKAWLEEYAQANHMNRAVLGISGGKDSTIVAKLLVDVLGKDNVFGLLMPNGEQKDISDSLRVVELLDIGYTTINIANTYYAMLDMFGGCKNISEEAQINIAPRIRMTTLYTWGQTHGYRVAGTGNLSERTLGYFTKWGDGGCDFNLIGEFTSLEVMLIGEELGLPIDLVYKTPADGLSGMSDEEKLGVSYIDVHKYLRYGKDYVNNTVIDKIEGMQKRALHKLNAIPIPDYRYCCVELPELGKVVTAKLKNGKQHKGFITKTSFYIEGIVFETLNFVDIRVNDIIDWEYIKEV